MHPRTFVCTALAMFFCPALSLADVGPESPEELREKATLIVSGRVKDVFARDRRTEDVGPDTIKRDYRITLEVRDVIKDPSGLVETGDDVELTCWEVVKRGEPLWEGTYGHYRRPQEGGTGIAYLNTEDEPYFILFPNGWQADETDGPQTPVVLIGPDQGAASSWADEPVVEVPDAPLIDPMWWLPIGIIGERSPDGRWGGGGSGSRSQPETVRSCG